MYKRIVNSLTDFNIKLYLVLISMLLIPTLYKTLRIYFLGDLPNDAGVNVASQILWLNVIFEIIQEALLLPLFFLLGHSVNNIKQLDNKIKTGIIATSIIYLILVLTIYIFAESLLSLMAQKKSMIELSANYIRLESIAIFISVVYRFTLIVLTLLNKVKRMFLLLTIQTIVTILCDTMLLSHFSFSMQCGVLGIAYANIITGLLLTTMSLFILEQEKVLLFKRTSLDYSWIREWYRVGSLSGLESLVRNTIFIIVILRLINQVEGQSSFWLSNSFIWSWLLIPIIALGDLIKKEIGENKVELKKVLKTSITTTTIVVILWIVTIPLWSYFFKNAMNISNPQTIINITLIAVVFYIAFAYNNIIDSIFYGLGRTDLMLAQSVIVNFLYYGILHFALRRINIEITLNIVVIIFGMGILLDSIITLGIYKHSLRKSKLVR